MARSKGGGAGWPGRRRDHRRGARSRRPVEHAYRVHIWGNLFEAGALYQAGKESESFLGQKIEERMKTSVPVARQPPQSGARSEEGHHAF